MKNRTTNFEAIVFGTIVFVTAAAMIVAGAKSLAGIGRFPYWHLPTLAIFFAFWESSLRPEDKSRIAAIARLLRMKCVRRVRQSSVTTRAKAAREYSDIFRAVRGLSALFIFKPEDRPQTEP